MTEKERLETIQRLKAWLECAKRRYSGTDKLCNENACEDCDLLYEQGTVGECKLALERAIEALSEEAIPIEWIWNWINTKGVFAQYISDMIEDWEKENEID